MDKTNVWLITAKTNIHVGNENTSSYGLIDKAIQRNVVTGLPCVNSSSLKGALNEYCSQGDNGKEKLSGAIRQDIFGVDKVGDKNNTQKGKYIFFDADILAIPEQLSDNSGRLFRSVTCKRILDLYAAKLTALGIPATGKELSDAVRAEVIDDKNFEMLCNDDNLPIIARNCIENGISRNLWYEQILPAETVLLTIIDDKGCKDLSDAIQGQIVQIGANATIGYGYCKMEHL